MADAVLARRNEAVPRRKAVRRKPGHRAHRANRVLLWLVILLLIVLVSEVLFHFVLVPHFRVTRIVVESDTRVPDEVVRNLAGISPGASLLTIDTDATAGRIAAHPAIRSATVDRSFPETLLLRVETRTPVAVVLADFDGEQRAVLADADGVLFERGALTQEKAADLRLPVLSGLSLVDFETSTELPIRLVGLVGRLKEMQLESPALYRQISEIRVVPRGSHEFEVMVYPMSYPVALRMGSDFSIEECTYALVVLDALRQDGRLSELTEIDARGGEMVLRLREDERG